MLLVALVALLIGGAFEGKRLALVLKEEVRARQSVVDQIDSTWKQDQSWIASLEPRIAKSRQQATPDPRHDHWTKQLAYHRASAARMSRVKPKYERLAARPWEAFPKDEGYERYYMDANELYYYNRYLDHTVFVLWSLCGGVLGVLPILGSALLLDWFASSRGVAPGWCVPPLQRTASFVRSLPQWGSTH
jgi:hypothetical protein